LDVLGVNFINVLHEAFTSADPKKAKNTVKLSLFFTLMSSGSIKAFRKMLVKRTPGVCSSVTKRHMFGKV